MIVYLFSSISAVSSWSSLLHPAVLKLEPCTSSSHVRHHASALILQEMNQRFAVWLFSRNFQYFPFDISAIVGTSGVSSATGGKIYLSELGTKL